MTFDEYHESFLFQVGEKMLGLDRASLATIIYKSGLSLDELTTKMRIAAGMQHPATYFRAMMKRPDGSIYEAQDEAARQERKKYNVPDDAKDFTNHYDRVEYYHPGKGRIMIEKFGRRAGEVRVFPVTQEEKGLA